MTRVRPLFAVLCLALPAFAANPSLEKARALVEDLAFEAALKALDAADKTEGNDQATVLEILRLQGITFGTLGKDAKTRDSFRKLLMLEPGSRLPGDVPPRVSKPFAEAQEWVATNGPLTATAASSVDDTRVKSVSVTVEKDVLRLARGVRFHLGVAGGERAVDVLLTAGKAEAPVAEAAVSWWAELLNERGGVLLKVGSARSPRQEGAVAVAVARVEASTSSGPIAGGWRRPLGFGVLGAGVVAAGVGVVLGLQATGSFSKVSGATRDAEGRVTGITQVAAAAAERDGRMQATVANTLFGVGGALAAAGVVLVIIGPSSEPTVALGPTAGGVMISGQF